MNDHERDVIARLARIEEQNCQIIAMLQGKWTAFGGYLNDPLNPFPAQRGQYELPQNWQGEKP